MNYLYKESTVSSPIDNVLIVGDFIVTHHHATLKVFDLSLNLVRTKYFYEKILKIKRINSLSFIILFDHGKVVQTDLDFNPMCLRLVEEMKNIETHNNYCIAYNFYSLKYFNMGEEEIKEFSFSSLYIYSVQAVFFMENYIPTILIVSKVNNMSKCSILSLDGKPIVVEEFNVIDNIMTAISKDKFIVFVSRNFIQIKYKRENYVINLNENIDSKLLTGLLSEYLIQATFDKCYETTHIFIENPHIFIKNDTIFILDSTGELYRISFKLDVKRIFSAQLAYVKKISCPSAIDHDLDYLIVGSCLNDTVLYHLTTDINNTRLGDVKDYIDVFKGTTGILSDRSPPSNTIKKYKMDDKLLDREDNNSKVKDKDCNPIETEDSIHYLSNSSTNKELLGPGNPQKTTIDVEYENNVTYCTDELIFTEKARIKHIGLVKYFEMKSNTSMLLTATKGLYLAKFTIDFEITQKLKTNFKVGKIFEGEGGLMVSAMSKFYKMSSDLKITVVEYDQALLNIQMFMNYKISCDGNKRLSFYKDNDVHFFHDHVDCWTVNFGKLALISKGTFKLIILPSFEVVFKNSTICSFENQFFNEIITTSSALVETGNISYNSKELTEDKEKVVEMLLFHSVNSFILFRTTKQLYIYQSTFGTLVKYFVPRPIIFGSGHQSLFCLNNVVYCRSKQPYFIFFNNGISVFPSQLKISYPVSLGKYIYGFYKGNLIKCKLDIEDYFISGKLLIKKVHTFDYKNDLKLQEKSISTPKEKNTLNNEPKLNSVVSVDGGMPQNNDEFIPRVLLEEYRNDKMVKQVITRSDCSIFVVSEYKDFDYIPFVPMVHISDPQTGKTHSEPINKEEAEFKNLFPALRARTLKYTIELRSVDFKLMSSIELEPNEFVCDLKMMFNDYLVLSTSFPEGEDKKSKGKLTVYALTDIVADPKNPHVTKKLKFISAETFKDPCIYSVEIRTQIATCVGTRLMIFEFNVNTGLCVMGINEISLLSTSLYATKNFLAVSDVFNGVFFFFLRPKDPLKIHLLGKSVPVLNCRFLLGIDYQLTNTADTELSLLAFDKFGTIHIFTYSPEHTGFRNSNLLIKRAEVVTKAQYPLMYSYAGRVNDNEALYFSCNLMSSIMTVNTSKIQILQHYIALFIDNSCGINARNYLETTGYTNLECKAVICERILLEFFFLKPTTQEKICELLGCDYGTASSIIENCLLYSNN